jgi:hypothetical protein
LIRLKPRAYLCSTPGLAGIRYQVYGIKTTPNGHLP